LSLQVASPETFGYTFVLSLRKGLIFKLLPKFQEM